MNPPGRITPEKTPSASPPLSQSRIRDHLANERTFLAWVRTALGLIGLGFVLARMGLFLRQIALAGGLADLHNLRSGQEFLIAGVVFLALGTGLCAVAGWLYHRNRWAIDQERYEPASTTVSFLTALLIMGGLLIMALVLWRTLSPE